MCDDIKFDLWEFDTSVWYGFSSQKFLFINYAHFDFQVPVFEILIIQELCDENKHDSSDLDSDSKTGHDMIK